MATLGTTAKPTTAQEAFGLNAVNQMSELVTLPGDSSDTYKITRLGAWLGGWNETASARLVVWSAAGTKITNSGLLTIANEGGLATGNTAQYESDITEFEVAGGTQLYVGWWRDPDTNVQNGRTGSGSHVHDTAGGSVENFGAWTSHIGKVGAYLFYEVADEPPTAPTIDEPDQNEVVTDQTPNIDWTTHDPDGDPQQHYQIQVDDQSNFSSPLDSGKTASSTTNHTMGTTLTRGTTYYARVRTWHNGVVSPWSSTRTFKIAALPTATVDKPGTDTTAPLYYLAGTDTSPKLNPDWTFNCPDGGTQTGASVKVYAENGTTLLHTHAHSGSATICQVNGFTPVNGTKYQISVTPTCSHAVAGNESPKKRCRARWGRASYRADLTAAPVTLSATVATTLNSGQAIIEYASSAATTPEPTDWKATIAEVTKQRYVWHRVTLIPAVAASPTSPSLNSITFTYSSNVLVPDGWTADAAFAVDQGTYVYGTQSIKHSGDGIENFMYQDVVCTPDTDYVLSGRMKQAGASGGRIQIVDPADGSVLAEVSATNDTDWARYMTEVVNSGSRTALRIRLRANGASGTNTWYDALKMEASRVVTPWTPGFLGDAVVLDAGGLQIDAAAGGIFRLRGSGGGARDTVKIGSDGLVFGGDAEIYSETANRLRLADGDYFDLPWFGRSIWRSSSQANAALSTWTKATGMADLLSGEMTQSNDCIVVPAGEPDAVYAIQIAGRITAGGSAKRFGIGFAVGASSDPGSATPTIRNTHLVHLSSANNCYLSATFFAQLSAGNFVALEFWQDVATNQGVDNLVLTVSRIGGRNM